MTTKGYDNFEISLVYDKAGFVSTSILHRVYKRYSFYDTFNDVHARSGFIVVGYILPPDVKDEAFKSQYVVLVIPCIQWSEQFPLTHRLQLVTQSTRLTISVQMEQDQE